MEGIGNIQRGEEAPPTLTIGVNSSTAGTQFSFSRKVTNVAHYNAWAIVAET
jgi:hypothetical protein